MIRPRAPSQSTLRYLRQIAFPRPCSPIALPCLRHSRRGVHHQKPTKPPKLPTPPILEDAPVSYKDNPALYPPFPDPDRPITPQIYSYYPEGPAAKQTREPEKEGNKRVGRLKPTKVPPRAFDLNSMHLHRSFLETLMHKRFDIAEKKLRSFRDLGVPDILITSMGKRLMAHYIKYERADDVPSLFAFLASRVESLDIRCVNLLLESFVVRKNYAKAFALFDHYMRNYRTRFSADYITYGLLVRAYVGLGKLKEAEQLIKELIRDRTLVTSTTFGYLIAGIKETTGSLEEMERVLGWMKTTSVNPGHFVYNVIIEHALLTGKSDVAKSYVKEMSDKGVRITAHSFGIFLTLQAKAGDWDAVHKTLGRLRDKSLQVPTKTFNTIMVQYAKSFGIENLERLFNLFVENKTEPSAVTYNIMVNAYLKAEDELAALQWISRMQDAGFKPNASTFNTLFSNLRRLRSAHPSILRRVYEYAMGDGKHLIDSRTTKMLLKSMEKSPYQKSEIRGMMSPKEKYDRDAPVLHAMDLDIRKGRLRDAMDWFRDYVYHGVEPSDALIEQAVRVCFLFPEEERAEAKNLLRIAGEEKGFRINEAMISHMREASLEEARQGTMGSYSQLLQRLMAEYEYRERNRMEISHRTTITAAKALLESSDPLGAIHVMNEISKTRWGAQTPWDLAGLTILLRTYITVRDLEGLKWVVQRLVESVEIPDRLFMRELAWAKQVFGTWEYSPQDRVLINELVEICKAHKERRREETRRKARKMLNTVMTRRRKTTEDEEASPAEGTAAMESAEVATKAMEADTTRIGGLGVLNARSNGSVQNHRLGYDLDYDGIL